MVESADGDACFSRKEPAGDSVGESSVMSCHSRTLRFQLPCVCYRRGANAEPIWACVIFTRARGATRGIRR
jgi:hypothetical protein